MHLTKMVRNLAIGESCWLDNHSCYNAATTAYRIAKLTGRKFTVRGATSGRPYGALCRMPYHWFILRVA